MKKNLKVLSLIILAIVISGCFNKLTPRDKVEDMMNKYIRGDANLLNELDSYIGKEELRQSEKERYRNIIKDEYATIKYEIKDEVIDGDEAEVTLHIEVKDLYKASKEASEYLKDHTEEFYDGATYDKEKFIDYKLSRMEAMEDYVEYTIVIELKNVDGIWTILELDNETLEKIHGIYNYEEDDET